MWDTLIECDTVKNCRILLADINNQDQFFYRKFSFDELFYIIPLFQLTRLDKSHFEIHSTMLSVRKSARKSFSTWQKRCCCSNIMEYYWFWSQNIAFVFWIFTWDASFPFFFGFFKVLNYLLIDDYFNEKSALKSTFAAATITTTIYSF